LKVNLNDRKEVKEFLERQQNINSLWKINNGYHFMCEMIFKNVNDLEDFLEKLEIKFKILKKEVYYIIDDILREDFMNHPLKMDLFEF